MKQPEVLDIGSWAPYPQKLLSNFAEHHFEYSGVYCHSMEGFLQSLKFEDPSMQKEVCLLVGKEAKYRGKGRDAWKATGQLFWKGYKYYRHGLDYQALLDEVYSEMYEQCPAFKRALRETKGSVLTHSIGKKDPKQTILTEFELCSRLMWMRENGNMIKKEYSPHLKTDVTTYLRAFNWPKGD